MLEYRKACVADAMSMWPRLRKEDMQELTLAVGNLQLEALVFSVMHSEVCICAEDDQGIVAIWGIVRKSIGGTVWMLGTDRMLKYQRILVTHAKPWIDTMLPHYGTLSNYVHEGNLKSIRWLKMLGFTLEPVQPFGEAQAPFHYFHITKE